MDWEVVKGVVLAYLRYCVYFPQGRKHSARDGILRAENKKSRRFQHEAEILTATTTTTTTTTTATTTTTTAAAAAAAAAAAVAAAAASRHFIPYYEVHR
jgi:hypothetical protein